MTVDELHEKTAAAIVELRGLLEKTQETALGAVTLATSEIKRLDDRIERVAGRVDQLDRMAEVTTRDHRRVISEIERLGTQIDEQERYIEGLRRIIAKTRLETV